MATTTARRHLSIFSFTCAVGALLLAACSSGNDTSAASPIEEPPGAASGTLDEPTTAAPLEAIEAIESTAAPVETTAAPEPTEATSAPGDATAPATTAAADPPTSSDPDDGVETAPPPGTTTTAAGDPADPQADGVDWTGIATALLDRHFLIAREPSLDLVREVCLEPSGCFDAAAQTVEVLQRDGVRVQGGAPYEVTSVEFQSTVGGTPVDTALAVNLIVRFVATDQGVVQLIDGSGAVVSDVAPDERFPPGQITARAVILGRDSAGAGWKLVALSDWM